MPLDPCVVWVRARPAASPGSRPGRVEQVNRRGQAHHRLLKVPRPASAARLRFNSVSSRATSPTASIARWSISACRTMFSCKPAAEATLCSMPDWTCCQFAAAASIERRPGLGLASGCLLVRLQNRLERLANRRLAVRRVGIRSNRPSNSAEASPSTASRNLCSYRSTANWVKYRIIENARATAVVSKATIRPAITEGAKSPTPAASLSHRQGDADHRAEKAQNRNRPDHRTDQTIGGVRPIGILVSQVFQFRVELFRGVRTLNVEQCKAETANQQMLPPPSGRSSRSASRHVASVTGVPPGSEGRCKRRRHRASSEYVQRLIAREGHSNQEQRRLDVLDRVTGTVAEHETALDHPLGPENVKNRVDKAAPEDGRTQNG